MNLSLFIARRYLVSKKSHNAVNIISGIALVGIVIGTMSLIIVLSAFNGISDLVKSLYNSFGSAIQITPVTGKTFIPYSPSFDSIRNLPEVKYAGGVMQDKALLKYGNSQCLSVIKGVDNAFVAMTRFDTLMREGSFYVKQGGTDYGAFGRGVADKLGLPENSTESFSIECYAPKRGLEQASLNPTSAISELHLYPCGEFSVNDDFDTKYVIVGLDFARKLFDYRDSSVTSMEIGLNDVGSSEKVKSEIRKILGIKFNVKDRYEQNELLFKTLKTEKLWTFIILVFILIIATFSIVGSLSMLILDKKKDIRILWDMGVGMASIRKIFLYEGILLTFVGAAGGIVLGTLVCMIQIYFKPIHFAPGFVVNSFPVKLELPDFLYVFLTVLGIGIFSSWYPARVFTQKGISFK